MLVSGPGVHLLARILYLCIIWFTFIYISFVLTGMRPLDLKAATLLRSSSLLLKGTANTVG